MIRIELSIADALVHKNEYGWSVRVIAHEPLRNRGIIRFLKNGDKYAVRNVWIRVNNEKEAKELKEAIIRNKDKLSFIREFSRTQNEGYRPVRNPETQEITGWEYCYIVPKETAEITTQEEVL